MAVESIRPRIEHEIQPRLDNPELIDALKKGNIYEILKALPRDVSIQEIDDYFKYQHRLFNQKLVQNDELYAGYATPPPPSFEKDFADISPEAELTPEDQTLLAAAITGKFATSSGMGGKAQTETKTEGKVLTADELLALGQQQYQDVQALNDELTQKIFEAQLQMEIQKKKGELDKIKSDLIKMVKSGADFGLIWAMMAKYVSTKNGIMMTAKSAEIKNQNELINKSTAELQNLSGSDPQEFAIQSTLTNQKIREGTWNLQQLTMDVQKIMQSIESWMATAKSAIDEYNRNKGELIRKSDVR